MTDDFPCRDGEGDVCGECDVCRSTYDPHPRIVGRCPSCRVGNWALCGHYFACDYCSHQRERSVAS